MIVFQLLHQKNWEKKLKSLIGWQVQSNVCHFFYLYTFLSFFVHFLLESKCEFISIFIYEIAQTEI